MPEMVEVQTIVDVISPQLLSGKIGKIDVFQPAVLANRTREEFEKELTGETIAEIKRRGKYILLTFFNGKVMMVHLRMTACISFWKAGQSIRSERRTDQ